MLLSPRPAVVYWMTLWADLDGVAAAARRRIGMGSGRASGELRRAAGDDRAAGAVAGDRRLLGAISVRPLTDRLVRQVKLVFVAVVAMLLIGHGALGLEGKQRARRQLRVAVSAGRRGANDAVDRRRRDRARARVGALAVGPARALRVRVEARRPNRCSSRPERRSGKSLSAAAATPRPSRWRSYSSSPLAAERAGRRAFTRDADVRSRLATLVGRLRAKYGPPAPPPAKTAFELVAWEKVAYLASDEKRANAFALLRRKIGLTPRKDSRRKPRGTDRRAGGGRHRRARTRQQSDQGRGAGGRRLRRLARRPVPRAASRSEEAVDANSRNRRARGREDPPVDAFTPGDGPRLERAARAHAARLRHDGEVLHDDLSLGDRRGALPELGSDIETLVDANLLLRAHGQTVCKTTTPRCGACVIRADCPSAR